MINKVRTRTMVPLFKNWSFSIVTMTSASSTVTIVTTKTSTSCVNNILHFYHDLMYKILNLSLLLNPP